MATTELAEDAGREERRSDGESGDTILDCFVGIPVYLKIIYCVTEI